MTYALVLHHMVIGGITIAPQHIRMIHISALQHILPTTETGNIYLSFI
jgi:hypothetical protein